MKNRIILTLGMIALVLSTVSCENLGNGKIDLPPIEVGGTYTKNGTTYKLVRGVDGIYRFEVVAVDPQK